MGAQTFSLYPPAELVSMFDYMMFLEINYCGVFKKKMSIFLQTKGSNQKEIEDFIQSLKILENPH